MNPIFTKPNCFVRQKSDKFSGGNFTETWSNGSICLRHQSSAKGDIIYFYLEYSRSGDPQSRFDNVEQPRLEMGELFILLNGNKRYSLMPQVVQPSSYRKETHHLDYVGCWDTVHWTEYMAYELSEDILREMANANTIELKVTGGTVSDVLYEHKDKISFSIMAKALYNAVFDNSLFLEELQKEQKRVEETHQIQKEWDELKDLCEKNMYDMGAFYGKKDCSFGTTTEEIIRKFGDYKSELYKHLNYCIPLYKKLYSHMHEFNTAFPNENISVEYGEGDEETIGQFVKKLEAVREQVNSSITTKRIIIIASIVVGVILLFVLFN